MKSTVSERSRPSPVRQATDGPEPGKLSPRRAPVVAFHGKEAAKAVSRAAGHARDVSLGVQRWQIARSRVFVVPSASGANRDVRRLEGKPSRVAWFIELRDLVDSLGR